MSSSRCCSAASVFCCSSIRPGGDRAELTILGVDERGDLLQERDQRRLELFEGDRSLVVAIDQRLDRLGGPRIDRVLALEPGREPL